MEAFNQERLIDSTHQAVRDHPINDKVRESEKNCILKRIKRSRTLAKWKVRFMVRYYNLANGNRLTIALPYFPNIFKCFMFPSPGKAFHSLAISTAKSRVKYIKTEANRAKHVDSLTLVILNCATLNAISHIHLQGILRNCLFTLLSALSGAYTYNAFLPI